MSVTTSWDEANARFLSAALERLRLRLTAFAEQRGAADGHPDSRRELERAEAAMQAALLGEPSPAAFLLEQRLGLHRFELDVLLLCAAVELDPSVQALLAAAHGDPKMSYPTFALALSLFDDASWDALSPLGGLRYWRLVEIVQPAGQPLTTSALRADERIVSYLKGLNYVDDRLEPLLTPVDIPAGTDPPSQRELAESIAARWSRADPGFLPIVQLVGPDLPSKHVVAARAAASLGRALYSLPAELLPAHAAELEDLARLWLRESMLTPVALYLDAQELDFSAQEGRGGSVARFLARCDGMVCLGTREVWTAVPRDHVPVDVERPTFAEQADAWGEALGVEGADSIPSELAGQFNLSIPTIERIGRLVPDTSTASPTLAWDGCVIATRPRMDALARRIEPKATWDDIVLPEAELSLLRRIASQVRHRSTVYERWGFAQRMNRGLGISALFAGPSGTGKSMAAEVIANDLRLSLYRIDLSAVVSKYIGETEKNLRRLFDAAEEGGALLFFDEADALFGKRSEVKDSHDRYANIEINYLLQRMEAYRGVAVLATNMKSALDPAFMRRIRFIVNFPFPSEAERQQMWKLAFPAATPTEPLDWHRLGLLPATGGTIHNIAVNAAFAAAQRDEPVSMEVLLEIARAEFRKLELPIVDRRLQLDGEVRA